jgi:hypothetical protein
LILCSYLTSLTALSVSNNSIGLKLGRDNRTHIKVSGGLNRHLQNLHSCP